MAGLWVAAGARPFKSVALEATGVSGRQMLKAIIAGQENEEQLAKLAHISTDQLQRYYMKRLQTLGLKATVESVRQAA